MKNRCDKKRDMCLMSLRTYDILFVFCLNRCLFDFILKHIDFIGFCDLGRVFRFLSKLLCISVFLKKI